MWMNINIVKINNKNKRKKIYEAGKHGNFQEDVCNRCENTRCQVPLVPELTHEKENKISSYNLKKYNTKIQTMNQIQTFRNHN